MGMSRRTKRGIAAFNHIQTSPNRLRYMMRKLELSPSLFSANVVQAAIAAGEILNAKLPAVPNEENSTVQTPTEIGEKQDLPDKPEVNPNSPERT